MVRRRVLSSALLQLIGSRPAERDTYELNLTNHDYKYNNYNKKLVGRSSGRCLRNRLLLSGCE
jgi:hypothetical protein